MIAKTEGIVLKSFDFRETSKIVTFFTKDYGKLKGILKGIRKDHKKFGSNVDKFSVNEIIFYHHLNSDLHLVGQCDLRAFYFPIRKDLKRTLAASYMLELVERIMPAEEENKEVYRLMLDYLASLETDPDINKLVHIFQIKILLLSGFQPHLDSCVKCNKPIKGKTRFSLPLGGLICADCPANEATVSMISPGTVASILHIEKTDWAGSLRLGLSASIKKELKFILNNFLVYHLERNLKSAKYLS